MPTCVSENFANRLSLLTELATKHPDLRDAYLSKSQLAASNFDIITDADRVKAQLEDLMPLFASIEAQLKKIKEGLYCVGFSWSCFVMKGQAGDAATLRVIVLLLLKHIHGA